MNNLAKSLLGRVEIHGRGTVTDNPRSLKIKAELAAKEAAQKNGGSANTKS